MSGFLHDDVFDNGLNTIVSAVKALHICTSQPLTYSQAMATTIANKTGVSAGACVDAASGRKTTIAAISGGTVTANGTAAFWALIDTANNKLLASNALSATQALTSGNTFSLAAFDISLPDPS